MKRLLLGALLATLLVGSVVALDADPAAACSCAVGTDADHYEQADAVFVGDVTGYEATEPMQSSQDPATWTFTVDRIYKGDVAREAQVLSAVSGASCGLEIPHEGTFVVFANAGEGGELEANLCGGTRAADGEIDPAVFGAGRLVAAPSAPVGDLVEEDTGSPNLLILVAAMLVLGAGVAIWFGLRRRRAA